MAMPLESASTATASCSAGAGSSTSASAARSWRTRAISSRAERRSRANSSAEERVADSSRPELDEQQVPVGFAGDELGQGAAGVAHDVPDGRLTLNSFCDGQPVARRCARASVRRRARPCWRSWNRQRPWSGPRSAATSSSDARSYPRSANTSPAAFSKPRACLSTCRAHTLLRLLGGRHHQHDTVRYSILSGIETPS